MALKAGHAWRLDSDFPDESCLQMRKSVWFSPEHDVAAWYWQMDTGSSAPANVSTHDSMRSILYHASRSQGVLVCGGHFGNWEDYEISEEIASLSKKTPSQKKTVFICLRMAAIHTTASKAFESGLWGTTGEEIVQVVDMWDTDQLRKFSHAANPADSEARQFFDDILTEKRRRRAQFFQSLNFGHRWVWRHWNTALERGFRDVPDPDLAWLDSRTNAKVRSTSMLSRISFDKTSGLSPNTDHPWVKSILDHMPTIRFTYAFRLCLLDCHTLPPRPEKWGQDWLDEHERRLEEQWHNSEKERMLFERR